ncbi:hypothetical protein BSR29_02965 [Boudabousia liubingyangii]|uniref:Uncharacterized protein n=2 Tax=Boudabousia TaxID=2767318 RepID=A0A1D9MLQ5_9ACTO|nr:MULTISPECIES: hypothetical protein [Boudabousia]AOZ73093.1 hypothetical protein BK816_07150 [Boudabousia tangfeifanii]OKL48833.1 hypothetical protein BSR29_02965 [Boudabousia liubingyangii]
MKYSAIRKFSGLALITALTIGTVGGISIANAAERSRAHVPCELYSYRPTISGSYVKGIGGRHGCINTVDWVRVSMWTNNWGPDTRLAVNQKGPVNTIQLDVSAKTSTAGKGAYVYTYVESSTGAVKYSPDIQL